MKKNFFENVKTKKELRTAYVSLIKKYHPDNGGSDEICAQINKEYEEIFSTLTDEATENSEEIKANQSLDKEIREALEKIIHFDGINIEVIGTWLWLDGNTYPYKEDLKKLGYAWSKTRKKWHFTPYSDKKYYKGSKKSFSQIRSKYGSTTIETEETKKIA